MPTWMPGANALTTSAPSRRRLLTMALVVVAVAGAFAVGGISGGAFNPAVVVGATIMGLLSPATDWIHLAGDFAGGAAAAFVFKFINPEDK